LKSVDECDSGVRQGCGIVETTKRWLGKIEFYKNPNFEEWKNCYAKRTGRTKVDNPESQG